jgi:hypothetical protein
MLSMALFEQNPHSHCKTNWVEKPDNRTRRTCTNETEGRRNNI